MNESSDEPPLLDRLRSWTRGKVHDSRFLLPFHSGDPNRHPLSLNGTGSRKNAADTNNTTSTSTTISRNASSSTEEGNSNTDRGGQDAVDTSPSKPPPPAPPPVDSQEKGEEHSPIDPEAKPGVVKRVCLVVKTIMMSSWINIGLVAVPVGIALGAMNRASGEHNHIITPAAVFAVNAVAIIPLAGLLAYATESVADHLGDTLGALLNVSFGNAVELIIFMYVIPGKLLAERISPFFTTLFSPIIVLVFPAFKEIRITQAALLGSILANLLLILGMCFVFGGLRFREQLYNATVTQMSACLLSLSVISLLLPTAFHASFNNIDAADRAVIKVSRGTSVILLLVYFLYLYFQLRSHAYMYESTPQHKIDEESHPGILAEFLNSSSSSESSSSSSSDSEDSSASISTAKKFKRRFKRRKRRKSSASSKDTTSVPSANMSPSINAKVAEDPFQTSLPSQQSLGPSHDAPVIESGDEADIDVALNDRSRSHSNLSPNVVKSRDFGTGKVTEGEGVSTAPSGRHDRKKRSKKERKAEKRAAKESMKEKSLEPVAAETGADAPDRSSARVDFASTAADVPENSPRKPFNVLGLSSSRPALSKARSGNIFSPSSHPPHQHQPAQSPDMPTLRRASSLPDRLNQRHVTPFTPAKLPLPHIMPVTSRPSGPGSEHKLTNSGKEFLSRDAAVTLLIVSTGLVAACAEFLVDSIDYLVEESGVSQAFIGLIILPIVGNAAEHVTAVTVASKNKMDLAIGVAIGSSIQIALFVTPIIVLLGWCLNTEMSLYFSLFETVSLFVSAFIVGFLIIDGRSNYLEGALLIAAYVIIAVLAYFYPSCENLSTASGPQDNSGQC